MGTQIDYTCPQCGAEAVVAPGLTGLYRSRVIVPHGPKCPIAARLAELRAQVARSERWPR